MNSEFAIGLVNIKKMDFSYLNRYSHYVLRRFFDYALNDKEWVDDIIHNGTSHINKEHLLIILILSCVHKDNKNIKTLIKICYTDLVSFKKNNKWKGRLQWKDFHDTLLGHLSWSNDSELLIFILQHLSIEFKNWNTDEKWRKTWYLKELRKMKEFTINTCVLSNNLHIITILLENNILKNSKKLHEILYYNGYVLNGNTIEKSPHINCIEWQILKNPEYSIKNIYAIDFTKLLYFSKKTNTNKDIIFDIFYELNNPKLFTDILFSLSKSELQYLTFSRIVFFLNKNINYITPLISNKVVLYTFIFENIDIIPSKFIRILINNKLSKLRLHDSIPLLLNFIRSHPSVNVENLKKFTENAIEYIDDSILINEECDWSLDDIYWIYKLFGNNSSISINESLNNKKNIKEKTCPICLDEIRNDDCVKLLCGHRYHHNCVKNDYTFRKCKDYQCAVCRSKIHPISLNL